MLNHNKENYEGECRRNKNVDDNIKLHYVNIPFYCMLLFDKDIKTIKDCFNDKPVLKAFLFVSYSWKEVTPKSDVHILVELDYSQHTRVNFVSMKLYLEEKRQKKTEFVLSGAISKYILPFINKHKQLIYEK